MNVWRTKDDTWFVLIITPDKLAPVAKAIGRPDLLTDPRFSNPAKLMANNHGEFDETDAAALRP
jgi:crotonobetainyl-CoA:carnitine CoA-transferase CaiB-like acyl-CoA transferase